MILKAAEVRAGDAIVWKDGTVQVVVGADVQSKYVELQVEGLESWEIEDCFSIAKPDDPIICVARNYPLEQP